MSPKEQSLDVDKPENIGPSAIDPRGLAPAWAENRTDLIESLPFFRQAQQGVYQHDKVILGALLDGYGGEHSYFDDDIVITKLDGGGDISIDAYMRHSTSRLEAAQKAKDKQSSIGLIIGSNASNPSFRIEPPKPCRYAVLGEYILTDLWHEYQDGGDSTVTVARYQRRRFLDLPWWKSHAMNATHYRDQKKRQVQLVSSGQSIRSKVCEACEEESPKRYKVWVCANPRCEKFSTMENGEALSKDVKFSAHWLLERVDCTGGTGLDFGPSRLKRPTQPADMRKGSVCPKCRKCVSRFHWGSWICEGPYGCGHRVLLPVKIPDLSSLLEERPKVFTQSRHPFHRLHDRQNLQREFVSQGTTFIEYQHGMPGGNMITLLKSRPPRTATPGTMFDDLFNSITWEANHGSYLDLQRYSAQNRVTGSRINRYEISFGEKELDGLPPRMALENAPASVQAVLEMLVELLKEHVQTNDTKTSGKSEDPWILTVTAYVGGEQKEGFKPAEYNTQGDVTATMCLGSPARVRWRYSPIHWNHSQTGKVLEGSPLPDTKHFEAVKQLKKRKLSLGEYEKKRLEILEGSDAPSTRRNEAPPTYLTAELTHGDILITQGESIGSFFDSTVEPQGLLHIRVTAFRAQDDNDGERGRGSMQLRRSTSRSRSRRASSTRAAPNQRASSRKRRNSVSRESTLGTRSSSRGRGDSRNHAPESAIARENEAPRSKQARRETRSPTQGPHRRSKSRSPELLKRPKANTRAAAKEAREKVKTQLRRSVSRSSSKVSTESSSDDEQQTSGKPKKSDSTIRRVPTPITAPTPRSILKRTVNSTPKTASKVPPRTTEEDAARIQKSETSAAENRHLSGRRFVYQTPAKSTVTSSVVTGLEYIETLPCSRLPSTEPVAESVTETNSPKIQKRSQPYFSLPRRQNPPRPQLRSTQGPSYDVSALGVPVPPSYRPQSGPPQEDDSADSHASTGENTPSPDLDYKLPPKDQQPGQLLLENPPPPDPTVSSNILSPSSSNTPPQQVHTQTRRTSTGIPPSSPSLNRKRSLSSSLRQELQEKTPEVISLSSSSQSTPEPQQRGEKQEGSESSSDDDNGASYRVPVAAPITPESRRSSSTSGRQRFGSVIGVAEGPARGDSAVSLGKRRLSSASGASVSWLEEADDDGEEETGDKKRRRRSGGKKVQVAPSRSLWRRLWGS
ncbi:hypothetical protein QBC40DRAFT_340870 [Triangularia verruculosa]|uniref:Uncharacterized protein n=1 Tax=Triangularia verruculosa TaxID=2587418 RepID=A0AAN6XJJ7_9PEZI|nr:hypothetical protein QBC40DRAFT_340870 [Triangularia verruculosa]